MASVSNSLVVTKGKLDAQGIGVYTGSCATEGNASIKVCTFDKEVAPLDGVQISITFSYANTAANVSLRVGKSEFPVYAGSKPLTNTSVNGWADNQTVNFMCSHEKWYMTSISSADIMEFSSKDGEGATLDIYNSKKSGFKASLGNTSLAFKYKNKGDTNDKVIAQYGVNGVSLYSAANDKTNEPYAQFGTTTTLGYAKSSRLEAGKDFLSMHDDMVSNEDENISEYFRVNRNALAFKTNDNSWFGISKAGRLGLLNDDLSISKSTMNGSNENLLKDTEKDIIINEEEKECEKNNNVITRSILVTNVEKIMNKGFYTLSFRATANRTVVLNVSIIIGSRQTKEERRISVENINIKTESVIFKKCLQIEDLKTNEYVWAVCFSFTESEDTSATTFTSVRIEAKTLKLEEGDASTDWCFPIDSTNKAIDSSQTLKDQLAVTKYLLGFNEEEISKVNWEKYSGCWGVEKDSNNNYSLVTNFLSANIIKAGVLKSLNYEEDKDELFSTNGLSIDLNSGNIKSPTLFLINEKNEETKKTTSLLSVKGNIEAFSGKIGGFAINTNSLSSIGADGSMVTISSEEDFLTCKQNVNGEPIFSISKSGSVSATKGIIGGLIITETGLSSSVEGGSTPSFYFNNNGTFSLGKDAIVYKDQKLSINSETVISSLATKNKAVEINNGDFPIQLTSNGNNLKMNSSGIIMSETVDSKELELIKLSTEGNIPNIIIGNSIEGSHISISSSQVDIETPGNGKMTLSGTDFSVNTKETTGTPACFSLNDKFVYNSKIGFLLTSASGKKTLDDIIENKGNQDISTYLGWITQDDTSDQKNVNLIATDKGLGFFSDGSPQIPIAYFTKDKLYVKRTQILDRQQISSFIWQKREGSDYLRTGEKNIGLKWLVNKKEG